MKGEAMEVRDASAGYALRLDMPVVPEGYKRTEVGVIPEDWNVVPLDCISLVTSGKRLPAGHYVTERETPHPYIRVSDMYQGGVITNDIKYVPQEAFPPISQYRIYKGELFISVAGTLGLVGVIPESLDGANLTENANRISEIACDRTYLLYVLLSDHVQGIIESIRTVGAQPKLALTRIRKFPIPLPPTGKEQRAIATALSDVDALLEALDRLIAKKRDIKQAAMQVLLTPPATTAMENGEGRMDNGDNPGNSQFSTIHSPLNTRLPGFEGEWEKKRLGDLGSFLKGSGVKRDDAQSGPLACVRYGELYTTHNDYIQTFHSWISEEVAAMATRLHVGDLLFAGSGETKEEIGKCVAFITDTDAYAGGDIVILRPKDVDSLFLGYVLNAPYVARQKASLGQGDAVVHISAAALAQVSLALPSVEEQTAIATALSGMDAEIEALEQRRAKTAALKQAMMQELLTGRTRLVEPDSVEEVTA